MAKQRLLDLAAIALAMLAFAGNSLLCRLALRETTIDPASFTTVRLAAGAAFLALLCARRPGASPRQAASWPSALALFAYAAAFSYAYLGLTAATGALILFGAVQIGMTAAGLLRGERPGPRQATGILLALGGLVYLLLPGVQRPPLGSAALMAIAGAAWAIYSLRGKKSADPLATTAGNFLLALLPAAALGLAAAALSVTGVRLDGQGLLYAAVSGAITSGAGYAVWYSVLPRITATQAAAVQLTVPVIATAGAVLLLGEAPTLRLAIAAIVVLGGVALTLRRTRQAPATVSSTIQGTS